VVVVLGPAAHVGVTTLGEQRVHGAVRAQQLDGSIGGRETQRRLELPRSLVQLCDREAARRLGDGPDDGPALRGRTEACGELKVAGHVSDPR
jgi:hypothetical protein